MRRLAQSSSGALVAALQRSRNSVADGSFLTPAVALLSTSSSSSDRSTHIPWLGAAALGLGTALAFGLVSTSPAEAKTAEPQKKAAAPAAAAAPKKGLPVYSKEEVAKHRTPEAGIWVTYKVTQHADSSDRYLGLTASLFEVKVIVWLTVGRGV